MAVHPTFQASIARLREWGVTVVFGPDVVPLPPAGAEDAGVDTVPWHLGLKALPRP
jgi:hypothetical protein